MTPEPIPPPAPPARKRKSGVVIPHRPTVEQRLGAGLVFLSIRSLALTLRRRWRVDDALSAMTPSEPVIFAIWHNRLALCLEIYRHLQRRHGRSRGMAAMVSASRDGGFLSAILEWYGVQPVRGSSSRRGPQALLELVGWAERGYDLAITPDGPRGPRYVVQEGVISLAQITGLPIIPTSYSLDWRVRAKSWDGFLAPLPFARWEVVAGKPIRVPGDASERARGMLRQELESTLRQITRD